MATEDLSRTGLVHMDIKNPIPGGEEQLPEEPIGFLAAERASTSLVAGQTEVNPLATDLPDTQLMNALTDYTNVNFNASLADSTIIGSSPYMTDGKIRKDTTTSEIIMPGKTSSEQTDFYQEMTNAIKPMTTIRREEAARVGLLGDPRMSGEGTLYDYRESFDLPYETTADFVQTFQSAPVVGNVEDYRNKIQPAVTSGFGAITATWGMLSENAFIKGIKNNPDKYMGNTKYIKNAEGWFGKQAQKQFGAIFEENPESAIKIAEANRAMYTYLNSTIDGQKKIREMGLSLDNINKNYEQAKTFETEANNIAKSYSAYQGEYSGSAEGVAAKKQAYANMSKNDLDNTNPAGHNQYSGMAIGGQGVYVDISDGIAPGTKFKSGTIFVKWKKEEREKRAIEEKEPTTITKKEPEITKIEPKPEPKSEPKPEPKPESKSWESDRGSGTGQTEGPVGMGSTPSPQASSGAYTGPSSYGRNLGGKVSFQEGGPIGNPMGQQQQEQQSVQDAGNLELIQEQGKDLSGVADDVKRDLNEGDFVINAPAMEMAGRGDIERMINKAVIELQRKGVKLDFGQAAEDTDSIVQALVSNKEMVIPKVIAEQIGYDRLEKINNRGKQRVDEIEKEKAQQEKGFVQPNPQGQSPQPVQMGGQITLEENKNQPIAIPRESFAGMSSVGKRLLSPLSPEQADKELTELSKPSQSFEGFVKPIRMADGGKVYNNPGNIEIATDALGKKLNESYGNGRFAVFNTKEEGLAAIPYTLEKYNTNSVADAINIWKPLNEVGNTLEANKSTINHIVKGLGKNTFDLSNPNDVKVLIEGITRFDSGADSLKYYDSKSIEKAADMYLGITPNNNINIIPKLKPQQTGMMAVN